MIDLTEMTHLEQAVEIHPAATVAVLRDAPKSGIEVLLLQRNSTLVFGPDHWVFPGGRIDALDFPDESSDRAGDIIVAAQKAAVRESHEEASLTLAFEELTPLSHWTTPDFSPRRYATWFFVVCYRGKENVQVDGSEIVNFEWITPQVALEQHSQGGKDMMPPTEMTLQEMLKFNNADDYIDMCSQRGFLVEGVAV